MTVICCDCVHRPGGIPARNFRGERLLLYIGIIDILQSYRLAKKLEHAMKSIIYDAVCLQLWLICLYDILWWFNVCASAAYRVTKNVTPLWLLKSLEQSCEMIKFFNRLIARLIFINFFNHALITVSMHILFVTFFNLFVSHLQVDVVSPLLLNASLYS